MGGGNSGLQSQRADKQGILHSTWAFGKELLLPAVCTQIAASAPEPVPLEVASSVEEELQIRYRVAELKLPSGVDMDVVAALLHSIRSPCTVRPSVPRRRSV